MTQEDRAAKLAAEQAKLGQRIRQHLHRTQVRRFVQQTTRNAYAKKVMEERLWQQLQQISTDDVC